MSTTVGLLGTGRMGSAMARALAVRGFGLMLWNRTPAPAKELATELGSRTAATPAEVAGAATVCLSMLADGAAVEAVFGGADGLIAGAGPGSILIDCSTVPPSVIRGLQAAAIDRGAELLDAPVSGSVSLATAGTLTLMVGGAAETLERARPVLDALGTTVVHIGPLGAGAAMKLAVNTVVFGLNQAVAEGLVLAEAAGIPRQLAYDVIGASAVAAPFVGYKRAAFVDPEGTPVAFSAELAAKDLRLIAGLASEVGQRLPQAATNLAVVDSMIEAGEGDRDFAAVARHLRELRMGEESASA